jgi:hypothetical protein
METAPKILHYEWLKLHHHHLAMGTTTLLLLHPQVHP